MSLRNQQAKSKVNGQKVNLKRQAETEAICLGAGCYAARHFGANVADYKVYLRKRLRNNDSAHQKKNVRIRIDER